MAINHTIDGHHKAHPASAALFLPRDIDHVRQLAIWMVMGIVVGAISGFTVHMLRELLLILASLRQPLGPFLFLLPAFGGLVNGVVLYRIDREARGDGIHVYIKSSGGLERPVGLRFVVVKTAATLSTLGSGGMGGLVGPFVAIHAGVGHVLSQWIPLLRNFLQDRETGLRTSGICGGAAAAGALLQAPLGGAILAVEILFGGSLAYRSLFPAIFASTSAFFVGAALGGGLPQTVWSHAPAAPHSSPEMIILVLVTSIAAGIAGILFVYMNRRLPSLLEQWRLPPMWRPALGGVLCGAVAVAAGREVLYCGTDLFGRTIPDLLAVPGTFPVGSLVVLMVGIGLATAFTVGGSGSGGLTMPAMILGVLTGTLLASAFSIAPVASLPLLVAGMTACLASSINIPIAAAVISLEIFGAGAGYAAVLGSVIGYQIGRGHLMYRYLPGRNA